MCIYEHGSGMHLRQNRLWHFRSKWDYLTLVPLAQWAGLLVVGVAILIAATGLAQPKTLALTGLAVVGGANTVAWIGGIGVIYGKDYQPHLSPSWLYLVAAFFFAPLVVPHYIWRTRQA